MLPKEISELLVKQGYSVRDNECQGAKFHSPRPLRIGRYKLGSDRIVYLCGTCRDNLGVYIALHEKENGLEWPVMRSFGNTLRALAQTVLDSKGIQNDQSA